MEIFPDALFFKLFSSPIRTNTDQDFDMKIIFFTSGTQIFSVKLHF